MKEQNNEIVHGKKGKTYHATVSNVAFIWLTLLSYSAARKRRGRAERSLFPSSERRYCLLLHARDTCMLSHRHWSFLFFRSRLLFRVFFLLGCFVHTRNIAVKPSGCALPFFLFLFLFYFLFTFLSHSHSCWHAQTSHHARLAGKESKGKGMGKHWCIHGLAQLSNVYYMGFSVSLSRAHSLSHTHGYHQLIQRGGKVKWTASGVWGTSWVGGSHV